MSKWGMISKRALVPAIALSGAMLVSPTYAQDAGKIEFDEYCAACHGTDGKGKGAKAVKDHLNASDLTQLSKNNDGHFPYERVRRILDGRPEKGKVRPHYVKDMPVWGRVFMAENPGSTAGSVLHQEAVVKMRILNLVDYLVSIQEK